MKRTDDLVFFDYESEPVPMAKRKGWILLGLIWIAIGIDLSGIMLGMELGAGLSFNDALISVVIGSLVLAVIGSLAAYVGARTGLSTGMISRYVFGEYGAMLITTLIGITLFGWFGVQTGFFGEYTHDFLKELFGFEVSVEIAALIGGLLMTSTAVIGYKAIEKLSMWAVPLMAGLMLGAVYILLSDKTVSLVINAPLLDTPISLGYAISQVIALFITGTVISPDVARWARSPRDAVYSTFFGFLIGNSIMLLIAIILVKATSTQELSKIFLGLGMGVPAVIILILGQWTTNDNNLYSSALSFSILFKRIPRYVIAVIVGLIGTGLGVAGIYDQFTTFLIYLTAFITPIGGIYVAQFFFVDQTRLTTFSRERQVLPVCWVSMVSWILATLVAFSTTPSSEGGFGWFTLTTIPALDAFLAAVILQVILGKSMMKLFPRSASITKDA